MNPLLVCFVVVACVILTVTGHGHHHEEDNGPAYYKFEYGVHDPHTGDKKQHHEVRDGHVVKGSYSLAEPDGTTRIVEYVAGPHTGFNAVVKRIGHAHHPQHYHHHGGAGSGYGGANYGGGAYSNVGVTHFGYKY